VEFVLLNYYEFTICRTQSNIVYGADVVYSRPI